MIPAISFQNLSVSFKEKTSLSDVSFDVQTGELTVVVGRSGSGKSTLLRAVNRLNSCFDGCHTTGRVEVNIGGEPVEINSPDTAPDYLRSRIGMVFQTPNVLPISIERNMLLPQQLVRGVTGQQATEKMEKALDDVGLFDEVKDRLDQPAETLSGGQQQRLCFARALALDPEILLLDEPTASVDYKSAEHIENLLLRLAPTLPMLIVSHSLSQTRNLADNIVLMREGSVAKKWNCKEESTPLEELLSTAF